MRTRTIMTVALLSAAGCGTSGSTRTAAATEPAETWSSPDTVAEPAAAPAPVTVTAVPAPVTAAATPAAPAPAVTLHELANELRNTDPAVVAVRLQHFRPLCDAKGFPLVGNLVTKSGAGGQPIESFCADLRAKGAP
jgi:hypothetical protein